MKHQLCKLCGERHPLAQPCARGAKGKRAPKPRKEVIGYRKRLHHSSGDKASAPAALKANGADPPTTRESADAILARRRAKDAARLAKWRKENPEKAKLSH